jgi:hypothetical protein
VADVEKASASSDRAVLRHDSFILERHLPAAELDHGCAGADVNIVEGRSERHPSRDPWAEAIKAFAWESI